MRAARYMVMCVDARPASPCLGIINLRGIKEASVYWRGCSLGKRAQERQGDRATVLVTIGVRCRL